MTPTSVKPRPPRSWLLAAGGAVVVAATAAAAGYAWRPTQPAVQQASLPLPDAPAPSAAPAASTPAPSFDVVRVSPAGTAVIAGQAEPGAEVTVFDGAKAIAQTRADQRGAFIALPAEPLPEGGRALTLASRDLGGQERRSDGTVVIVVPPAVPPAAEPLPAEPPAAAPGPVAVLVPAAGPPRVLQAQRRAGPVSLDLLDYTGDGGIRFSGAARPHAAVRLYVDGAYTGDAQAGAEGRWVVAPPGTVTPGLHTLRLDEIDQSGRVLSRIELPFLRAAASAAGEAERVVVQPGQNLWRLARAAYGRGVRYTVIYLANQDQIRDPRLIYPGQAFNVPK